MASPSLTPPSPCGKISLPMSIDSDITGNGVVANYIGTASFAVFLVIMYFLMVYDPMQDPFKETDQDTLRSSFRPNPVDVVFLRGLRDTSKRVFRWRHHRFSARMERIFIKCTLSMGDLQILTGLSILISGYVQMSKDLSSYHWMVIVNLAWFSSLTHLACLTVIRNFLYNHPLQRTVRLFFMGILAILLIVGLSFTGNYTWVSFDFWDFEDLWSSPSSPFETKMMAITYPATCRSTTSPVEYTPNWPYLSMLLSIILIVMGFLGRVIKLYKILSVGLCSRLRSWASVRILHCLRWTFSRFCLNRSSRSLRRTLVYRPLLAVFVTVELGLDWWSSFLLEVGYLAFGFVWGNFRLFAVLGIPRNIYESQERKHPYPPLLSNEGKHDDWGFGQVIAALLLMAPLTTIIDHLEHDCTSIVSADMGLGDNTPSYLPPEVQLPVADELPSMCGVLKDPDDPDNDWAARSSTINLATGYIVSLSFIIFVWGLNNMNYSGTPSAGATVLLYSFASAVGLLIVGLVGIFGVVLFSLTIEADLPKGYSCVRRILRFSIVIFFSMINSVIWFFGGQKSWVWPISSESGFEVWVPSASAAGFYILFAISYRAWELFDTKTPSLVN
ncbi:hypothetical protein BDW42DRAFT_160284 [Aspergillus taichungensis]|uniref:Transmembrane protein n=1 Tax=Aspergillus taichungensis TaxID=482145 RepID=A0A2J5I6P9_9EURO|nr:hypothetical protein BDW42DRAFT_160284 [Aspergillus taichungensis]